MNGLDNKSHALKHGNCGKNLKQTFYRGSKLRNPLGKWLKTSSVYDTVYILKLNLIQKTTSNETLTSQVLRTRTKITSCINW